MRVKLPSFDWWRTILFLVPSIAIYTIVLGALSVTSVVFDRGGRFAHGCARLWSRLILATTGVRVRIEGVEHAPRNSPCIFVSNHQSIYDIPIVFASLPAQVRIIAKESLAKVPFIGWHLRRTGHLLVDRRNPDRAAIFTHWSRQVAAGLSLIVFPEGTRSVDGRVAHFKAGSFMLAIEAGIPVVPVALCGSRHVMTKGRVTVRPGEVVVRVHEPIATTGYQVGVNDARQLAERVRRIVAASVESLLEESLRTNGITCAESWFGHAHHDPERRRRVEGRTHHSHADDFRPPRS